MPKVTPVLDVNGVVSTPEGNRHVMVELAKMITGFNADDEPILENTVEEDTVLFKSASFADLDAMVEW